MESVAVAGVGLIGGSFGLALRQQGFAGPILGVSSPGAIAAALEAGAISRRASLEEAAETADLLYLAQPVDRILSTIESLAGPAASRWRRRPLLITDAGSTKRAIVEQAARFLPEHSFLGGHPMAGKERSGVEAAEAELFRDRPYVLSRPPGFSNVFEADFRRQLAGFGARIMELDAAEHDSVVAFTSHLPQLLSTVLAATLNSAANPLYAQLHGTGLLDMTRLAQSSPTLWASIIATNRVDILRALAAFSVELGAIKDAIEQDSISTLFVSSATFSASLRK